MEEQLEDAFRAARQRLADDERQIGGLELTTLDASKLNNSAGARLSMTLPRDPRRTKLRVA
jgi:hypothetical protein